VDDSIVIKFNENSAINGGAFTNDFKLDTILKSCMYWIYKASSDIKNAGISGTPTAEGWLNLIKSYWIFSKIREDPRSEWMVRELQAILALVSTVRALIPGTVLRSSGTFLNNKLGNCFFNEETSGGQD